MRGYNKYNMLHAFLLNPSLPPWGIPSFLIYTQRKGTSPSPLSLCDIPTAIFSLKWRGNVSREREIFELRHNLRWGRVGEGKI
jgi:hypothetical protein